LTALPGWGPCLKLVLSSRKKDAGGIAGETGLLLGKKEKDLRVGGTLKKYREIGESRDRCRGVDRRSPEVLATQPAKQMEEKKGTRKGTTIDLKHPTPRGAVLHEGKQMQHVNALGVPSDVPNWADLG